MDKPMSSIFFKFMTLMFRIRDYLQPRMDLLKEAGIEPGFHVLDYGCGPGSYIAPLAELLSNNGKIYALDIHPAAIKKVKEIALRKGIGCIETIISNCETGLLDDKVDVVLLYDVFHGLSRPNDVLRELHRVLKSGGILSFSDHHMKKKDILARVTGTGQFKFLKKDKKTYSFLKVG